MRLLALLARHAPEPALVLSANRYHRFDDELVGRETLERLYLLGQTDQDEQLVALPAQYRQQRRLVPLGVGTDDLRDDLPALGAQLRARGVLVVAAEPGDHLLEVHGHVHCLLVDRRMLVPCHEKMARKLTRATRASKGAEVG